MIAKLKYDGWFKIDHKVEDEDRVRDVISDVMGDCQSAVDIWVTPVGRSVPEWWLGSVNIADREEPSVEDIDMNDGLLRLGDVITFYFEQPVEGADFLARWR